MLRHRRYCARHATQLLEGENDQLSVTFEFLIRQESLRLAVDKQPEAPRRRSPRTRPAAEPPCPACAAGAVAQQAEAQRLIARLEDAARRAEYARGPGLCRQHRELVAQAASPELQEFLRQDALERLERLAKELQLYFHRLDYRFRQEPHGEEQTAWRRALRYFWGGPDR